MLIKIGDFEFTEVWDGVLYKKLSRYPDISDWEMRTLIEFTEYEECYGRACEIECDDKELLNVLLNKLRFKDRYRNIPRPELITECTACPKWKGCVTDLVCHTTSCENAIKIFQTGKLLSARLARNLPVEQLIKEKRNAANDPADYFDYVMLSWGNCQAGDRLVTERKLGRFPNENDLSVNFTPAIRFYFRYDDLSKHPNCCFDGVLPMKIKDEIDLPKWVCAIVIPEVLRSALANVIPSELKSRILYLRNDCKDIWEWSEKVYEAVKRF